MNATKLKVADLFFELIESGLMLRVDNGELCYRGAKGVLTPERREALVASKTELLSLLQPETEYSLLSQQQQRLWLLFHWEPQSPLYNMPLSMRLQGPLNREALAQALSELSRRHSALRSTFPLIDSRPVQAVAAPQSSDLPLEFHDLRHWPESERQSQAEIFTNDEGVRPFDVRNGPLCRACLLQSGDEEWSLLLTMHHIISDGWSLRILFEEITQLYTAFSQGEPSPFDTVPPDYSLFSLWQKQWLQSDASQAQLEYWKAKLGGDNQTSGQASFARIPTDFPRPELRTYPGDVHFTKISSDLKADLKTLATREGATLFMALLAVFQIVLGQMAQSEVVRVGSAIANRNRNQTKSTVGFFVNTLALQTKLDGNPTFLEVLRRARETSLGAFAHQELPFEIVVDALHETTNKQTAHGETTTEESATGARVQADTSQHARAQFQVFFVFQNIPWKPIQMPSVSIELQIEQTPTAKFELALAIYEGEHDLSAKWEFNTDLFRPETVAKIATHYGRLLQIIAAQPNLKLSDLPQPDADYIATATTEFISPAPETPAVFLAPRDAEEEKIAAIWRRLLQVENIGVRDDFFDVGGHSLLAIRLLDEVEKLSGQQLSLAMFFQQPTIEGQAALLKSEDNSASRSLITLQKGGDKPALFCIDGAVRYRALASHLSPDQPVYGLIPEDATAGQWYSFDKIGARVREYVKIIKKVQPHGPYNLAGLSFAGVVALMVAQQLRKSGEEVSLLALFDTYGPGYFVLPPGQRFSLHWRAWKKMDARERTKYLAERARRRLKFQPKNNTKVAEETVAEYSPQRSQEEWDDAWQIDNLARRLSTSEKDYLRRLIALMQRRPETARYHGQTVIFIAQDQPMGFMEADTNRGWGDFLPNLQTYSVPGTHTGMIQEPHIADVARLLNERLNNTLSDAGNS